MRIKEGENILFKAHSGISDPNDNSVGTVIMRLGHQLPTWKEDGEYYYLVKTDIGWLYDETSSTEISHLVGEECLSKLEMGSTYWLVREKNIIGKWDGSRVIPDMINFRLLKYNFKNKNS